MGHQVQHVTVEQVTRRVWVGAERLKLREKIDPNNASVASHEAVQHRCEDLLTRPSREILPRNTAETFKIKPKLRVHRQCHTGPDHKRQSRDFYLFLYPVFFLFLVCGVN